jgi:integrase
MFNGTTPYRQGGYRQKEKNAMPKRVAPLSDIQVKSAKPKDADYKLTDGGGLYLLITPTGGKLWRLDYRFDGKRKTYTCGTYPATSLVNARKKREEAREQIEAGIDPGAVKKAVKAAVRAVTEHSFEVVAREWHEKFKSTWTPGHAATTFRRMELDLFPFLGARDIGEITPPEVLGVLRKVEARGALETAHRIKTIAAQVFRYAIATGRRSDHDPTISLKGSLPPSTPEHFPSITDPKRVTELLRSMDDFKGSIVVRAALWLAAYTFVRPGELRHMEWSEIDLDAAMWDIPAGKMKMKVSHFVPLCGQAVDLLRELQPLTGGGKYVFPCNRSAARAMSENTINAALRRMGYEKEEFTGHGFRAMARTLLDEKLKCPAAHIEAQLAHAVKDANGRAYNRTTFLDDRKTMMQRWADYLDGLKAVAKVIPIRRAIGE